MCIYLWAKCGIFLRFSSGRLSLTTSQMGHLLPPGTTHPLRAPRPPLRPDPIRFFEATICLWPKFHFQPSLPAIYPRVRDGWGFTGINNILWHFNFLHFTLGKPEFTTPLLLNYLRQYVAVRFLHWVIPDCFYTGQCQIVFTLGNARFCTCIEIALTFTILNKEMR